MGLDAALQIASGGLANVNRQLALVSHNIANASTPDYAAEYATQHEITADGIGLGVLTGAIGRNVDAALQDDVFRQESVVSGLKTTRTALAAIDTVLGTPGQGNDLPSLLGELSDRFGALLNDPSSATQQRSVVAAADSLARSLNATSAAYTKQRQGAHNDLVDAVSSLNQALGTIGTLSAQIVKRKSGGFSTADLENQRDAALRTVSDLVSVKALVQASGDMLVVTTGGLALPTRGVGTPLSIGGAALDPGAFYPGGGVPGVTLNGQDVTGQLTGGRVGAAIALRDSTLPTFQAELDEFAQSLASRFDVQGLTLFTDPTGAVPTSAAPPAQSGYIGFAGTIQVNAAVAADPSMVRDGTAVVSGSPSAASAFTPNPPGGPAGFSTLITRVLDYALGTEAQSGVPQPPSHTSGLGPAGNLAAPYAPPPTLAGLAAALVGAQSQASGAAADDLATHQALHDSLASRLSAASGVSMDKEMSTMLALQTSYSANARVMTVVKSLFDDLMNVVR